MRKAADYCAIEHLRDGRAIEMRALRPDDLEEMLAAIGRTSPQSLRRRFFVPKRGFSETELAFFMNIDSTFMSRSSHKSMRMDGRRSSEVDATSLSGLARPKSPSSWSMHIRGWVSERPSCVIWLAWRATQD